MTEKLARYLAGIVGDDLDLPSFVCEKLEVNFKKENYESIYEFIVKRKKEILKKNAKE